MTTCAEIVTRAIGLSVANAGVLDVTQAADVQDALVRINQMQAKAWTRFTAANKTAYLTTANVTSTVGASERTVDLSALTSKVQRIITVKIAATGVEVALVDPNVPTAELAPRYYTRGEVLYEVSNDWNTSSSAGVALTVLYASRPTDLDVSAAGTLAQAVTVPERYCDLLAYDLGAYLAEKDVGREMAEVSDLLAKRDACLADWIESAAQFGGTAVYAFEIPAPSVTSKD